jgi:hypothetical protein
MARQNVQFVAVKTARKPVRLKFKSKSGETVSFKALQTVENRKVVRFRSKKK